MTGLSVTLFPPKEKKRRSGATKMMAFRCPDDLREYVEEMSGRGYDKTETIVKLMRLARAVEKELADGLQRAEEIARGENVELGRVVGRLADLGLKQYDREKRKR